jgi:hypothetical protein
MIIRDSHIMRDAHRFHEKVLRDTHDSGTYDAKL